MSTKNSFLDHEKLVFNELPITLIVFDQKFYQYKESSFAYGQFLHHMNRIIDPLPVLKKADDVQMFLNTSNEHQWSGDLKGPLFKKAPNDKIPILENFADFTFKTRVVCFFFDKSEYKEDIQRLRDDARKLALRANLRIAYVTDNKLIKRMKKQPEFAALFPDVGLSSCALKRYDGHLTIYDVSSSQNPIMFHRWISKNSMKSIEKLDNEAILMQ